MLRSCISFKTRVGDAEEESLNCDESVKGCVSSARMAGRHDEELPCGR